MKARIAMTTIDPTWLVVGSLGLALLSLGLGLVTSYIKMSVVFGLLRSGLGVQQVPGTVVIMSLSLALTSYVMTPVFEKTFDVAPTLQFSHHVSRDSLRAFSVLLQPLREFLSKHSGAREVEVLSSLEGASDESDRRDSFQVLIPAFVLTELKEAFSMGFALLLPFLLIDLVVANVLVGMGMNMVSPVMISLPLKLILFVMADGWLLLSAGLVRSYGEGGV